MVSGASVWRAGCVLEEWTKRWTAFYEQEGKETFLFCTFNMRNTLVRFKNSAFSLNNQQNYTNRIKTYIHKATLSMWQQIMQRQWF
jgi:hypothetical protein